MMSKLFLKFSSVFLRLHVFFVRQAKKRDSLKPYILKNEPSVSDAKIIHVIANFIIGGSTQLMVDIIERTSHKYRHKIIVPDYSVPLPYQPVDIYKFSIDEMGKMYEFLKNEKPTIVHIHYYVRESTRYEGKAFWYYGVFKICAELGIKVIQNVNVPTKPYENSSVVHNVFVSHYVRDTFNNSNPVASSVIYPGSDFRHFNNDDVDVSVLNTIGMVYRLDQDKLTKESIEVFIKVVKLRPYVHCHIVGGGFYLSYYKQRVKEENLKKNFTFTGFVSYEALPAYYKKVGIFITPVYDESFGQVTPFAMNMGLVVAGYNIGALSEILGYDETLVQFNDIDRLATLVSELIQNAQKRKQLGDINKLRALQYSVQNMINDYINLYDIYV